MLSTHFKCIFVRISKVASTSIMKTFRESDPEKKKGYYLLQHQPIEFYLEKYPSEFQEYYKFAFVRNPWDRIYSQYTYQRYNRKLPVADCSFKEWLFKCDEALHTESGFLFGRSRDIFMKHLTNQLGWISLQGKLAVDFVGKFETLKEDFNTVCTENNFDLALKQLNTSKKRSDYREAYKTDSMIELVNGWHNLDLEYFGYKF